MQAGARGYLPGSSCGFREQKATLDGSLSVPPGSVAVLLKVDGAIGWRAGVIN